MKKYFLRKLNEFFRFYDKAEQIVPNRCNFESLDERYCHIITTFCNKFCPNFYPYYYKAHHEFLIDYLKIINPKKYENGNVEYWRVHDKEIYAALFIFCLLEKSQYLDHFGIKLTGIQPETIENYINSFQNENN